MKIYFLLWIFILVGYCQEPITINLTKVYNKGLKIQDKYGNFVANPDYTLLPEGQRELGETYDSSITNEGDLTYYGPLYFFTSDGSAYAKLNILMDTGSSWLWAWSSSGSGCPSYRTLQSNLFFPSSSVSNTWSSCSDSGTKTINYGSGSISGNIKYTKVGLSSSASSAISFLKTIEVTNTKLSIGSTNWSGIVGLLPSTSSGSDLFIQKLFDSSIIPANSFGVYYTDSTSGSTITFGGFDTNRVSSISKFTFTTLLDTTYWKVSLRSVKYGNSTLENTSSAAVLDSGTSLIMWKSDTFNSFKSSLRNQLWGTLSSGFYACPCNSENDFSSLYFLFNNYEYQVEPKEYISVTYVSGKKYCYFYLAASSSYLYLGDAFFRNYYIYHDISNKRVGLYGSYMVYYDSPPKDLLYIIIGACVGLIALVVGVWVCCCCICSGQKITKTSKGMYCSAPPLRRGAKRPTKPVSFATFTLLYWAE